MMMLVYNYYYNNYYYYLMYNVGERDPKHKAREPNSRMSKGPSLHQFRSDTWTKPEEGKHDDHADLN